VSGNPIEVGDVKRGVNHDKTVVNIDSSGISTPPHSGEGCGDTQIRLDFHQKMFELCPRGTTISHAGPVMLTMARQTRNGAEEQHDGSVRFSIGAKICVDFVVRLHET
jgi:hypothetical protein